MTEALPPGAAREIAFVRLKMRVSLTVIIVAAIMPLYRTPMWLDIALWVAAVLVTSLAAWHVQQVWRACRRHGISFWRFSTRGKL